MDRPSTREVQLKILEIFKEFKKVCDENGLVYYAIGGTAIGAVRHNGFIPWDDDLDVAMPYDDYRRFIEIADEKLPDDLRLFDCNSHLHNTLLFVKVHDINTCFVEKAELGFTDDYKGVYIDIMPICGFPSGDNEQKAHAAKIQKLVRLNRKSRQRYKENKKLKSKALWILSKPFNMIVPSDYYFKKWKAVIEEYSCNDSEYYGFVWSPRIGPSRVFPKEWFGDGTDVRFEDTYVRCPQDYDSFLTRVFGDYMTLPPVEERKVHQAGIIDLEHSYKDYQ